MSFLSSFFSTPQQNEDKRRASTVTRPPGPYPAPAAPHAGSGAPGSAAIGSVSSNAPSVKSPTGGGFFNLPAPGAHAAGSSTSSHSTMGGGGGGGDMFGSLSVKASGTPAFGQSGIPAPAPASFGLGPSPAPSVTPSGFSFLAAPAPAPTGVSASGSGATGGSVAPPMPSSFSFMLGGGGGGGETGSSTTDASGAPTAAAASSSGGGGLDSGPASAFAFLSGLQGTPASSTAGPTSTTNSFSPPAPAPHSFGAPFTHTGGMSGGMSGGVGVGDSLGSLPVVPVTAVSTTVLPTSNIRKKKGGFRPGFAREEGEGHGGGTASSILSGLNVHEEAEEGHGSSGTGGGGMLAGLRVHAASDASAGDMPRSDEGAGEPPQQHGFLIQQTTVNGREARSSSTTMAPMGSFLAGLQIRSASPSLPLTAPAPTTSTGMFAGLGAPSTGMNNGGGAREEEESPLDRAVANMNTSEPPAFTALGTGTSHTSQVFGGAHAKVPAPAPAPAPARTPTRSLSPTSRMRGSLAGLGEGAARTRARLEELKARARAVTEADRQALADIAAIRERLARVESQQNDAIRSEQFEAAEALNGTLEGLRSALASAEAEKRRVAIEKIGVDADQRDVFAEALAVVTETFMGVNKYIEDRETSLVKFRRDAITRHNATRDRLGNEEEQLRLKEEHVHKDQQLVEEEAQQVERAICDQTNELDAQVTQMRTHHAELVAEVEDLERRLEAKRREERTAASQLEDSESRIKQIRSKFDKQAKRLQVKKASVEAERHECDHEAQTLAQARRDFATLQGKDRSAEAVLLRQLQSADAEAGLVEQLRAALTEQGQRRSAWMSTAAIAAAKTTELQGGLDVAQRKLREIQSEKAALEAQASTIRSSLASIDSKIPQFNEEKKAAVAERKFKEAGRLTDEIKRLSTQREEAERELSTCVSGVDECDTQMAAQQGHLASVRAKLLEHEKGVDVARMDALRGAVVVLRRSMRKLKRPFKSASKIAKVVLAGPVLEEPEAADVSVVPTAPTDAAIGIFHDGVGLTPAQKAALEFLEAERASLLDELNNVCNKHGADLDIAPETESEAEGEVAAAAPAPSPTVTSPQQTLPEAAAAVAVEASLTEATVPLTAAGDETPFGEGENGASAPGEGIDEALEEATHTLHGADVPADADIVAALAEMAGANGGYAEGGVSEGEDDGHASPAAGAGAGSSGSGSRQVTEAEVRTLSQAYNSVLTAIKEKEDTIAEAVMREDFDTADSAQADIDSFMDHKEVLLARAHSFGLSAEYLVAWQPADSVTANSLSSAATSANVTPLVAASSHEPEASAAPTTLSSAAPSNGDQQHPSPSPTEGDAPAPADSAHAAAASASSFSFLTALASPPPAVHGEHAPTEPANTGFSFITSLQQPSGGGEGNGAEHATPGSASVPLADGAAAVSPSDE